MATAAAAIIAKARRRILDHLMYANAVSPESAIDYEPSGAIPARQFQRLCNAGVVRKTTKGQYWVDIPAYRHWANQRRGLAAALLIVVVLAAAIGAIISAGGILM